MARWFARRVGLFPDRHRRRGLDYVSSRRQNAEVRRRSFLEQPLPELFRFEAWVATMCFIRCAKSPRAFSKGLQNAKTGGNCPAWILSGHWDVWSLCRYDYYGQPGLRHFRQPVPDEPVTNRWLIRLR